MPFAEPGPSAPAAAADCAIELEGAESVIGPSTRISPG